MFLINLFISVKKQLSFIPQLSDALYNIFKTEYNSIYK